MNEVKQDVVNKESLLPESPYKGLMPYTEADAPFFFGRENERDIIIANLKAWRLTILYGESGVGKSSVLQAGVANKLRQLTQENLAETGSPGFAVLVFNEWRDNPVESLTRGIEKVVSDAWGGEVFPAVPSSRTLTQVLHTWTERLEGKLFIILDQFEEYFLYHGQEDGEGSFAVEFPRALNRQDLQVNFLITIRDDSLAKLDRFKGRIPNLFDNYLRIEHLNIDAAREAILKPLEQYNKLLPLEEPKVSIEPELVETVLQQVRTGQVIVGETGRGTIIERSKNYTNETQIETPYLQLVLNRLWQEEQNKGSQTLQLATLNELGSAEKIVRTHLDAFMNTLPAEEREAAVRLFHYLVTPSGTKIAHTVTDLIDYTKMSRDLVEILDAIASYV